MHDKDTILGQYRVDKNRKNSHMFIIYMIFCLNLNQKTLSSTH